MLKLILFDHLYAVMIWQMRLEKDPQETYLVILSRVNMWDIRALQQPKWGNQSASSIQTLGLVTDAWQVFWGGQSRPKIYLASSISYQLYSSILMSTSQNIKLSVIYLTFYLLPACRMRGFEIIEKVYYTELGYPCVHLGWLLQFSDQVLY